MTKIKLEQIVMQNTRLAKALLKYGKHISTCNSQDPMQARIFDNEFIPGKCNCGWQEILDSKGE